MTKHTPSSPEGEAPRRTRRISDYGGTFDRRPAVPAPSALSAYDRLARWIDMEKSGRDEMWDYDPRPDIERLILGFRYLYDSAVLVEAGCDTGHINLGLDAARKSVGVPS